MTLSYKRHDSYIYVTWLIHLRDMTHFYVIPCLLFIKHWRHSRLHKQTQDRINVHGEYGGAKDARCGDNRWQPYLPWCLILCVAVYCSVLQYIAVCCRILQCVVVCCRDLQWFAVSCSESQWVADWKTLDAAKIVDSCALMWVAVSCSESQWVAVSCSELQWVAVSCSELQWVAVSCSELQCVADYRSCTAVLTSTPRPVCEWKVYECVWIYTNTSFRMHVRVYLRAYVCVSKLAWATHQT